MLLKGLSLRLEIPKPSGHDVSCYVLFLRPQVNKAKPVFQ